LVPTAPEQVIGYVPAALDDAAVVVQVGFVVNVTLGLSVYVSVGTAPPATIVWLFAVTVTAVLFAVTVIVPAT
jgi:hypothetical protein